MAGVRARQARTHQPHVVERQSRRGRADGVRDVAAAGVRQRGGQRVARQRRVARLEEALLNASRDLLEGRKVAPATTQELRALRPLLLALAPAQVASVEDVYELAGPSGVEVLHRAVTRADRLYLVALDGETLAPRLGCGPALATCELVFRGRLRAADLDEIETQDPEWASHLSQE